MHHYNYPGGMRHDMMSYGMMNVTWIWLIGFILLAVIMLIGIYLIMKQLKQMKFEQQKEMKKRKEGEEEKNPLLILQTRFAQGEITEEQYKQKRQVLKDHES